MARVRSWRGYAQHLRTQIPSLFDEFVPDLRLRYGLTVSPTAGSAHSFAIEFVGCPTNEADLVVMSLSAGMWPGKLVAAKHFKESR